MNVLQPNTTDPAIRHRRIELLVGANRLADAEKEIEAGWRPQRMRTPPF